jgi:ubiquinone/menaquinone biosynthesis C-methylase UbiE
MGFIYDYIGADDPASYELENEIADPERRIERFMESRVPFHGIALADVGAGGGFHACRYAHKAARVFAIEPAPKMLAQFYARLTGSGLMNVSVISSEAGEIPLRSGLVDVVHSRFAYFFGPERETVRSCEPGIREALRILKPGGWFFIIDNALTTGQFAAILARYGYSKGQAAEMQQRNDAFYAGHGFEHATVESTWSAPDRVSLRRVMALEFGGQPIDELMGEFEGIVLSYHYRVYYQQKCPGRSTE